ncbi:MAG: hypothetical protein DRP87_18465 [Spirochaetes bacterium]|nr:MAG: hypothetical protein DRP87_18465 [Spirochaetota bacterium]
MYVDKTRYIYELASVSTPYFISRPRRFGKSLTVSTFYTEINTTDERQVEYARNHRLTPDRITGTWMRESLLTTYEIEQAPPVSFLIQAGYLTFKEWDSELGYLVDYPNKEVRDSISHLVIMGTYGIDEWVQDELKNNIIAGLREGDFEKIFGQMKRTLAAIPYNLYEQRESYYHSVILTLLRATGIDAAAEEITNLGRSDIVIRYRDHVYVLELKRGRA